MRLKGAVRSVQRATTSKEIMECDVRSSLFRASHTTVIQPLPDDSMRHRHKTGDRYVINLSAGSRAAAYSNISFAAPFPGCKPEYLGLPRSVTLCRAPLPPSVRSDLCEAGPLVEEPKSPR